MSDELFSYRLRKYRDENGVSQEDMGVALGVTARYVSMMESGQKDVDPTSAIAKLFGLLEENKIPFDSFVGRRNNGSRHAKHVASTVGEETAVYTAGTKSTGSAKFVTNRLAIMMERIRQDVEMMADSSEAQRRELAVSAKNHIDQLVAWMNAKD